MATIECTGLAAGTPVIACISEASNYLIGWFLIITIAAIIYWRLARDNQQDRLTATLIVTTIIAMLGTIGGVLFPPQYFTWALILLIATVAFSIANKRRNL